MTAPSKNYRLNFFIHALFCAFFTGLPLLSTAETMVTTRETELKEDHFLDSNTLAKIPFPASVEALKFESGWVQVKYNNKLGWVRAMSVKGSSSVEVSSISKVETGRSGQKNSMSTTGVRSLSKGSRHALIVGCSDGIGLALVGRLLEDGWRVTGVSRRPSPVDHHAYRHEVADVADAGYPDTLARLLATAPRATS